MHLIFEALNNALSFSVCYAYLIHDVTVGDLDLVDVICKEKKHMKEVALIKKILLC